MSGLFKVDHSYEDESGCDRAKHIGVFSTRERADAIVSDLMLMPGFKDHPDGFCVEEIVVDRVGWAEGFIHI